MLTNSIRLTFLCKPTTYENNDLFIRFLRVIQKSIQFPNEIFIWFTALGFTITMTSELLPNKNPIVHLEFQS